MMNRDSFTNSLLSTISASRKISRYTYQPLQAEVSRYGALTALSLRSKTCFTAVCPPFICPRTTTCFG